MKRRHDGFGTVSRLFCFSFISLYRQLNVVELGTIVRKLQCAKCTRPENNLGVRFCRVPHFYQLCSPHVYTSNMCGMVLCSSSVTSLRLTHTLLLQPRGKLVLSSIATVCAQSADQAYVTRNSEVSPIRLLTAAEIVPVSTQLTVESGRVYQMSMRRAGLGGTSF